VAEVRRASADDQTRRLHVIVLKEQGGSRRLPIYTGSAEAIALACSLEAVEMPRPMTYQMADSLHDMELAAQALPDDPDLA